MRWQDVLPVLISIIVIILVAVLEKQSKTVAAITATMPLHTALGLWIVYSSNRGDQLALTQFSQGLIIGIIPTLGFLLAVWLASKAGYSFVPMIVSGYAAWTVILAVMYGVNRYILG